MKQDKNFIGLKPESSIFVLVMSHG